MARCKVEGPTCTVEMSVLGYRPNFGANVFFAAAFGICTLAILAVGIRKKTWSFTFYLTLGALFEVVGYVGRVLMDPNVYHKFGFKVNIIGLILAPTLICAAMYLTLKHITLAISPSLSRLQPRLYPIIFVPADVSCLIFQAIGGGIAATLDDEKILKHANRLIIAGIALQVGVLLIFGVVGAEYLIRVKKHVAQHGLGAAPAWGDRNLQIFIRAISAAYICIAIRCIYRIAEMAGGWRNHIMQDEISFMVLDSALVLIAVALLALFPPGVYFPTMNKSGAGVMETEYEKNGMRYGSREGSDSA